MRNAARWCPAKFSIDLAAPGVTRMLALQSLTDDTGDGHFKVIVMQLH